MTALLYAFLILLFFFAFAGIIVWFLGTDDRRQRKTQAAITKRNEFDQALAIEACSIICDLLRDHERGFNTPFIYSDPNFIEYMKAEVMKQCAGNSNCTLVITNGESGVNVNVAPQQ